jgi:hypothetical protein
MDASKGWLRLATPTGHVPATHRLYPGIGPEPTVAFAPVPRVLG